MATQTHLPDALERERREIERRERRCLAKRKSVLSREQRDVAYSRLLVEAKEECNLLIEFAEKNAAAIMENAKVEAKRMIDSEMSKCDQLIQRRSALRKRMMRHEAVFASQQINQDSELEVDPEAAAEFRKKDAARKREAYKIRKQALQLETPDRAEAEVEVDENDSRPNRAPRSVNHVVTWAARNVLRRLDRFNHQAKILFFQRFWLHRSVKRFQPVGFGLNASVGAAVVDMKQSLHLVKTARRKDHLATKRALLTTLVGQTIVGNRYQTALAKALGVKRQNMYRASKIRKCIDADESVRYPMGERKVRSDKISNEVRQIVEKYWESNTRISPCTKDKAKLRLARKVHEEHRVHWLEDTEVEFFLRFQDWCRTEGNGVDIGLRSFQYLKPYYIRTMKDRLVCCCKQHVEMIS